MSEDRLLVLLARYRWRFRAASALLAVLMGTAAAGLVLAAATLTAWAPGSRQQAASIVLLTVTAGFAWNAWRRWSLQHVAHAIEARDRSLENLLITAEEIAGRRTKAPHASLALEVFEGALQRLEAAEADKVQPIARFGMLAGLAVASVAALLVLPPTESVRGHAPRPESSLDATPLSPGDLHVVVTPPAYTRQRPAESVNPTMLSVLEGSGIRLEVIEPAGTVVLHELDGRQTRFRDEGNKVTLEVAASVSRPLIVRQRSGAEEESDRLVYLRVTRDASPTVAIREPGKDLMFPEGKGEIAVEVEAQDDVALQSLALRYTRVSGAGETFTFEEGEWPLHVTHEGSTSWRARGTLSLENLKLQDGDALVYRAVARDTKPGSEPAASDTFLVEIGRLAGAASTGFALPDERERQAISQQMLIIKTERLHADQPAMSPQAFAEQAQLLAIEQRMVKAEFVFMTGGEVEDEVEEAAHAHELAEGRLENTGQVELLSAIREMSRAEARLNAADTAQALEFERAALKALQRAFDRRRYLLRTLPERTRIDLSRRLSGERASARSSTAGGQSKPDDQYLHNARALLRDLASHGPRDNPALLASRLLRVEADSEALQQAALQLTSATDATTRAAAVRRAQDAVLDLLRRRMAAQRTSILARDPLEGRLTQELAGPGSKR